MNKPFHHGDIDFEPLKKIPKVAKLLTATKQYTVALGSNSGHAHMLGSDVEFEVYELGERTFYDLPAPAKISHEEHLTFDVPAGMYEQKQEQEYEPWSKQVRKVVD